MTRMDVMQAFNGFMEEVERLEKENLELREFGEERVINAEARMKVLSTLLNCPQYRVVDEVERLQEELESYFKGDKT